MSKKKRAGYGRLLDAWIPPEDAGEPVGCLATTFTFSADFFEEECLSRFLSMESDPREDGAVYLVEREEKLAGIRCAAVLVDQHHCRGSRNLRWDLLCARLPRGIMHAKISFLYWSNFIRLIISSANITPQGYRVNREIFGVLDFRPGGEGPVICLQETIGFLKDLTKYAEDDGNETPATLRWRALLDEASRAVAAWRIKEYNNRRSPLVVNTLFIDPKRPDAFNALKGLWPEASPPRWAFVTSPFFDPPEVENLPAKEIWNLMSRRGEAEVTYNVLAEEDEDAGVLYIHAPRSLKDATPAGRPKVKTTFERLPQEENGHIRDLHIKSIWLENDTCALYMIGSSNFTSAGLGLTGGSNIEANLVYVVRKKGPDDKVLKKLDESYLYGEEIDERGVELRWEPASPEGEDAPRPEEVILPRAFGQAVYHLDEKKKAFIELSFNSEPPAGWSIGLDGKDESFFNEPQWKAMGSPMGCIRLPWTRTQPPSGFEVSWKGSGGKPWWPVIISGPESLPPPETLRKLSLEELINILTSSSPLHESMRRLLKKREQGRKKDETPELDPHKRVDTSSFILQRTRRFSWALNGLRERLEKPLPTVEALRWILYGPVGARALCDAILSGAKNDDERAFLLAELALELSRVKPKETEGSISPQLIKREITDLIRDIRAELPAGFNENPKMKSYVDKVFMEALK